MSTSAMSPDYYQLLGVETAFDIEDMKAKYHALALRLHPDKNPDNENATAQFQELNNAFTTLTDPHKRQLYDIKINRFKVSDFELAETNCTNLKRKVAKARTERHGKHATCEDATKEDEQKPVEPFIGTPEEVFKQEQEVFRRFRQAMDMNNATYHGKTAAFVRRQAERAKNSSKRGNMGKERISHYCLDDESMKESFEIFRRWEQRKAAAMALECSESQQQNSTVQIGSDSTTTNGLEMVVGKGPDHLTGRRRNQNAPLSKKEKGLKKKLKKAKQKLQNAKDAAVFAEGLARVKKHQARHAAESNAQPKDKDAKRNVKEPQTGATGHTPSETNHSSKVRHSSTRESASLPQSHGSRKAQSFVATVEEYEDDQNDRDYPNPLEDNDDEFMIGYIAGLKEAEAAAAQLQTPGQPANTKFDDTMKERQSKKAENYKTFSERTVEDNSSDVSSLGRARENHDGLSTQVKAWIQIRANEMQEEELNSIDLLGPDSIVQNVVSATMIRVMRHESKSQSGSLGRTVALKFYT